MKELVIIVLVVIFILAFVGFIRIGRWIDKSSNEIEKEYKNNYEDLKGVERDEEILGI